MNPNPLCREAERSAAAAALGIAADASPAQARKAFLQCLTEFEFLPSASLEQAIGAFDKKIAESPRLQPSAVEREIETEQLLRADFENFRELFWSIDPVQRHECWERLMSRCKERPAFAQQLRELIPGLHLTRQNLPDVSGPEGEIVEALFDNFVLPPAERALRRRACVEANIYQPAVVMANRLRQIGRSMPEVAKLDPQLLNQLSQLSILNESRHRMSDRARKSPQTQSTKENSNWPLWLVFFVAFSIVRFAFQGADRTTPTYNPAPVPKYSPVEPLKSSTREGPNENGAPEDELRHRLDWIKGAPVPSDRNDPPPAGIPPDLWQKMSKSTKDRFRAQLPPQEPNPTPKGGPP